tara:strand:+ start:1295 stop:1450 length:156 start_codon:yes stop_codon:yes gene_type:complete
LTNALLSTLGVSGSRLAFIRQDARSIRATSTSFVEKRQIIVRGFADNRQIR